MSSTVLSPGQGSSASANTVPTLRVCVPGDEYALSLVGAASFLESFAGTLAGEDVLAHCQRQHSVETYAYWLRTPGYTLCMAELRGAPVGYAVLSPPELPMIPTSAEDIELKRIYLLHRFQGSGLGKQLMHWSLETAQAQGRERLLLAVYSGNTSALRFYERHSFTQVGTRTFHIGEGRYLDYLLARPVAMGSSGFAS